MNFPRQIKNSLIVNFLWLRAEIAVTDGRLMGIEREMHATAEQDIVLKQNLTSMEQELRDLIDTLAQRRRDLDNYLTAGLAGTSKEALFMLFYVWLE